MKQSNDFLTSLFSILQSYTTQSFLIAYSGGLDSHVLLHAISKLKNHADIPNVRVIHIDHGLQSDSAVWSAHCKKTAELLGVPCEIIELNLQIPEGESLEAVARDARYAAFKNILQKSEVLLTAHHQNDQAETVLLQLFRGSGVDGLAAMPEAKAFAEGVLLRPLLNFSQQILQEYAEYNQLEYIDDPSNFNTDFDRNFLRHNVIPLLQTRWKGINKSLSRVARLQAEAKALIEENTQIDLAAVAPVEPKRTTRITTQNISLSIEAILTFSMIRQKAIIRLWLRQLNFKMPSEVKLKHILQDVLHAKADAKPCVDWDDIEIRRYKNNLYAVQKTTNHDASRIVSWDTSRPLQLDGLNCTLQPKILAKWQATLQQSDNVTVRFRQGGEQIRLQGHKQTASLKKLMQAANIPPWERDQMPLIYLNNKLIMVYPHWSTDI